MNPRPQVLAVVAGVLAVVLLMTTVIAVSASRRAAEQERRVEELTAEITELQDRVASLEEGGPRGGVLDGLLGGELDGLLDGLLGGDGPADLRDLLDGLLSGVSGEVPGARCLTPEGGVGGLLDGLGGILGGGSSASADPETVVEEITDQVAELRELSFTGEVEVAFLDDDALRAEIEAILDRDLDRDDLAARSEVLVALRAIPADADLEQLQRDLLAEQVAGFYSPEDERLVVRTPDGGDLRPLDRVVLAHELDHALVDQAVGLPDLDDGADADAALARLSVIEGDATLLMNRWTLEHLSFTEQIGLVGAGDLVAQQEQLDAVPHHLARELVFPYTAGLELVCERWLTGGWEAVDAAYADPPTTTAGVLFPERADQPAAAAPALRAPAGAEERLRDTFGAAPLLWLLEAPGGDEDAALDAPGERAAAWAGGEVTLWDVDGDRVVGLALRDRQAGDPALCASVTDWYAAAVPGAARAGTGDEVRFTGDGDAAVLRCDGDAVRLVIAPDVATATGVVDVDRA
jgi:hypothetical protein